MVVLEISCCSARLLFYSPFFQVTFSFLPPSFICASLLLLSAAFQVFLTSLVQVLGDTVLPPAFSFTKLLIASAFLSLVFSSIR
jgi:hypothetical protein